MGAITWLTSVNPEDFQGAIVISMIFFHHMSLRDSQGLYTYKPRFYARVTSEGVVPFTMQNLHGTKMETPRWHCLLVMGRSTRFPFVGPPPYSAGAAGCSCLLRMEGCNASALFACLQAPNEHIIF
jgi:hypothetical protein